MHTGDSGSHEGDLGSSGVFGNQEVLGGSLGELEGGGGDMGSGPGGLGTEAQVGVIGGSVSDIGSRGRVLDESTKGLESHVGDSEGLADGEGGRGEGHTLVPTKTNLVRSACKYFHFLCQNYHFHPIICST